MIPRDHRRTAYGTLDNINLNSEFETADYADFADPERIAHSFAPPRFCPIRNGAASSEWLHPG